jgi:PKD repeat protein/ABC-type branched-subunit amino acid transport system substrate-binding protein
MVGVMGDTGQAVEIGVIFPSSDWAEERSLAHLISWAQEDINQYMEENGQSYRFEFLIENAEASSANHLDRVMNLHLNGVDLIIGGAWSGQALGSLPFINTAEMLLLSPSSTAPTLSIPGDNLYRLSWSDSFLVPIIAEMLWSYGIEACIVIQGEEYGEDPIYTIFEDNYESMGGVIIDSPISSDDGADSNFMERAENIAHEAADEYGVENVGILTIRHGEITAFLGHVQDFQTLYKLKWFRIVGDMDQWILEEAIEEADHLKVYGLQPSLSNFPRYQDLNERFYDETGEDLDSYGANWYDACWIYALSVVEIGSAEAVYVKKVLPRVASSYTGASGPFILDENGDRLPGDHDIWGSGIGDDGSHLYEKFGHYDHITAEATWAPDLNRPTPQVNDELIVDANGPYSTTLGEPVFLSSTGSRNPDGKIEVYRWSFGDGRVSYGENAIHTYLASGTYKVTLKVTDENGAIKKDTTFCTIFPPPNKAPVVNVNGPYTGFVGEAIIFNSSGSDDVDGKIWEYRWDFGDESGYYQGESQNHMYSETGMFQITLRVTDNEGLEDTASTLCSVSPNVNIAPVVNLNGPYEGNVEIPVMFNSSGTSDPDGTIIGYRWDFGDGSEPNYGENPRHTYSQIGNYYVTLQVTDTDGASATATSLCTIFDPSNRAPTTDANGPYTGFAGYPVPFKSTGSDDPDGKITTYEWTFGDGSISDSINPRHTYQNNGTYTVTLRVTDNKGAEDSTTTTCVVAPYNLWGIILSMLGSVMDPSTWSLEIFAFVFAITGTLIGGTIGIARWIRNNRIKNNLANRAFQEHMETMDTIYTQNKMNSRQFEAELNNLRPKVMDDYKKSFLDERKFNILDKRIDEYILEIRAELGQTKLREIRERLKEDYQRMKNEGNLEDRDFNVLKQIIESTQGLAEEYRKELRELVAGWRKEHQ